MVSKFEVTLGNSPLVKRKDKWIVMGIVMHTPKVDYFQGEN